MTASALNARHGPAESPEADPGPALDRIPEPFLGRWTGENHACTNPSPDVDVMYLEPRKVVFWGSFAQVLEVTEMDGFELILRIEYHESGSPVGDGHENGPAVQPLDMILRLSADQAMLTTIIGDRGVQVRRRCPST